VGLFKWTRRAIILLLLASVALLAVSAVQVVKASRTSSAPAAVGPASAVIVVGAATGREHATGELQARCAHGLALWRAHRAQVVITTGGAATPSAPTEASLAGSWLLAHGLPASSLETVPDASLAAALASIARRYGTAGGDRTILVGAPLQVLWLRDLAASEGLNAQVSPASASSDSLAAYVRTLWSQAVAVALGRIIGFDHTQRFGQ
jgi:hypothetical protein